MPPIITEERPSTEERVSRIEGEQRCLATKADVAELRAELPARIAELRAEVIAELRASSTRRIRWMIALWSVAVIYIAIVYWLLG